MGKLLAKFYDGITKNQEKKYFRDVRQNLLSEVKGKVLEVGAGTGATAGLYPTENVTEIVLAEPDKHMRRKLIEKLEAGSKKQYPVTPTVSDGALPSLSYGDGEFDYILCSFVLCTVKDPESSCRELRRVLKPGGKLLFLEHVLAPKGTKTRRLQPLLDWVWNVAYEGCHTMRETHKTIESVFEEVQMESLVLPFKDTGIDRFMHYGTASVSP